MKYLEARALCHSTLDEYKYYDVGMIDYEKCDFLIYTDRHKSDFVIVQFPQIIDLRVKRESLFED